MNMTQNTTTTNRANGSKLPLRMLAVSLVLCLCSCIPSRAQASQSESGYWQLVRGLGSTLYWAAWPTARYDHMEFEDVEFQPGGADVYVVLYGRGFEGLLWTEVVTEIRNGEVRKMYFGRYSSDAIFAPGFTLATFSVALDELNKQLQEQQRQRNGQP